MNLEGKPEENLRAKLPLRATASRTRLKAAAVQCSLGAENKPQG